MSEVLCCCSSHCTKLLTGIYMCILSLTGISVISEICKGKLILRSLSFLIMTMVTSLVDFSHLTLSMTVSEALFRQNRLWTSKRLGENVFLFTSDNSQMSGPPRGFKRSTRYVICWHILVTLIGTTVENIWRFAPGVLYSCPLQGLLYNNIPWRVSSIYPVRKRGFKEGAENPLSG